MTIPPTGPLAGVRILEVANYIAGPYGGALLADLGAEVIKIENPDGGYPFRGWERGGAQLSGGTRDRCAGG